MEFVIAGSKTIISDMYVPQQNGISTTMEVGSGNLKLQFDSRKGISYHYLNQRTLVFSLSLSVYHAHTLSWMERKKLKDRKSQLGMSHLFCCF